MLKPGDKIPEFRYDTPYQPQNSFYALAAQKPLCMVFLPNFGHPITRYFVARYAQDHVQLRDVALVCVVRSRPEVISAHLPEGSLPFTLICDAEGVLYDYFCIPTTKSRLKAYSVLTIKILNEAKKQGYQPPRDEELFCPLTLVVGPEGRVLFSHYGQTLTDLPENCSAIRNFSRNVLAQARQEGILAPAAPRFRGQGKLSALENPELPPEKQQHIREAMSLLYGDEEGEEQEEPGEEEPEK